MHSTFACTSFLHCLFQFQTLLAGVLAIIAALLTTAGIVWAANHPVKIQLKLKKVQEIKRAIYISHKFFTDLRFLSQHARYAHGTITVVIASGRNVTEKTRQQTTLVFPSFINEWESMVLLPDDLYKKALSLMRVVFDHNFDMQRAGGAFGADNFREVILRRTQSIEIQAFELSNDIMRFARALEHPPTSYQKAVQALRAVFAFMRRSPNNI